MSGSVPDSSAVSPMMDRSESVLSTESMSSWDMISRQESTGDRPKHLTLGSPTDSNDIPLSAESGSLDSILERSCEGDPTIVIRRPTLPSRSNRRNLKSLLDSVSLNEFSMSPDSDTDKYCSSPDVASGPRSPRISRVKPLKRGESIRKERPLSWTSRSLNSLNSLTNLFKSSTTIEAVGKCSDGSYIFEFEEESTHLTPKTPKCSTPPSSNTENSNSTEAPRDHPNSANQSEVKIAEFYTPNSSSGAPGTDHAPQIVHGQNGSATDHSTLVQRTFKFLNQRSTADHDKGEEERYNPLNIKDDQGNPLLLMIYSYEKEGYTIEGGTLEQLVEQLYCGTCPDADYIQTFLLGYKLFMQSEELMDMLLQKFEESNSYEEEQGDMVKLRLSNIVTQWLERVWVDFHYSDVMIDKVDRFVQLVSSGHPRFLPVAMKLENTMQKKKRDWEESLREEDRQSGSLPGSGCASPAESPVQIRRSNSDTKNNDNSKNKKRKPITLMDTTPSQFARHLHCVDFELMSKVEIHEYFTYFCRKKDPKYHLLTQHLDNWINHWNKVSAWVTSEILRDESPRGRAAKIEKLIDIAKQLKQLFSFNTLYAFVTGFNHSSVMRLKKTWDHVKSSSQTSLNDLEEFMSNVENFGQYRKHLGKVPKTVCTIPLLSLILRDIEFLNVNSAKLKNGLWNFGKLRLIKNKISQLERYKMIKPQNYIQTDDDIIAFCRRLQTIPSSSFYDLSLEREPKDQPRPTRPVSVSSLSSVATSSSS